MSEKKPKPKKKAPKKLALQNLKNPLIGGGIIAAVAIAGIVSGIVILSRSQEKFTFYYGMNYNPFYMDPIEAWADWVSPFIIVQVTEGLFDYDYTSEGGRLINNLASDYLWSADALNLTCTLRQGVKFHDGTHFNAEVVKWNIDRLHRLITDAGIDFLWQLPDGRWIINKTITLDEYTVRFVLNQPFVPLRSLLASMASYIVSPISTPYNDFLDISEDLVGTGPFMYNTFEENISVTLERNSNYWGSINNSIDEIIFTIFSDDTLNSTARFNAMLAGSLTMTYAGGPWVEEDREALRNTPGITVQKTTSYWPNFLIMNTEFINATLRKAISYAFNYSYFLNQLRGLNETRLRSPIPKGMLYSNWEDFEVPYYNVTIARQTLKDGIGPNNSLVASLPIDDDAAWEQLTNNNPIAIFNFSYFNSYTERGLVLFTENLRQIGIRLEAEPLSDFEFFSRAYGINGYDKNLQLFKLGWVVNYNDPHNIISYLFSNTAFDNWAQVDDSLIQQWLEEGIVETNETRREQVYYDIQKRLIEDIYPMLWLYTEDYYDVHVSNLRGFNSLKYTFKDVYFV